MSTPFPGIWFGVRRSPLRTLKQVQALVAQLPAQVQLVGVMGYEAQVAGVGDKSPQAMLNPVEMLADFRHPILISNDDDSIGDFFRSEVDMVNRSAVVDDEFGLWYFVHGFFYKCNK